MAADGPQESERSHFSLKSILKVFHLGRGRAPEPVMDQQTTEQVRAVLGSLKEVTDWLVRYGGIIFDDGTFFEGPFVPQLDQPNRTYSRNIVMPIRFRDEGRDLLRELDREGILRFDNEAIVSDRYRFDLLSCLAAKGEDEVARTQIKNGLRGIPLVVVNSNLKDPEKASMLVKPLASFVSGEYKKMGIVAGVDPQTAASAALTQAIGPQA